MVTSSSKKIFVFSSDMEIKTKAGQVLELEQSRDNVVQVNQQLMENSSSLQLQIKNLESVSSTPSSDELPKVGFLFAYLIKFYRQLYA